MFAVHVVQGVSKYIVNYSSKKKLYKQSQEIEIEIHFIQTSNGFTRK